MVRKERLELSRLSALVPKTSASTNSATLAYVFDLVINSLNTKGDIVSQMIPSGKAHNQMLLGPEDEKEISEEGKTLV